MTIHTNRQTQHTTHKTKTVQNKHTPKKTTRNQTHKNKTSQIKNSVCLITGGAGFIGSHLVDALAQKELHNKVIILDNLRTGKLGSTAYSFPKQKQKEKYYFIWVLRFLNNRRKNHYKHLSQMF